MPDAERNRLEWPAWIDDVLRFGPIAELEVEWRAAIGDAITRVLDDRRETLTGRPRSEATDA
jgi:hypothetical protein